MDNPLQGKPDKEASVWETIQTFEAILDLFPDDIGALEGLGAAYLETNSPDKAADMFLRLARLLSDAGEQKRVYEVTHQILALFPENQEALTLHLKAANAIGAEPLQKASNAVTAREPEEAPPLETPLHYNLEDEMELADFLVRNELITTEQRDTAITNLQRGEQAPTGEVTLSLLVELQAMENVYLDKILDFLCRKTNTPFIDVSRFEINEQLADIVPRTIGHQIGMLPFACLGDEFMIAVLNPLARGTHEALQAHLNSRAHFYLTSPDAFESAHQNLP